MTIAPLLKKVTAKLTSILTPNLSKDNVVIHLMTGAFFPLLFDCIGLNHGFPNLWIAGVWIIAAWTPFKEFYWDPRHETVELSGGLLGDLSDFTEYMIGLGLFMLVKFS